MICVNHRILICCTCHFQSGSLCLFGFFCLQVSSESNFWLKWAKVASYLGSLVQSGCVEGGALQTSITGMCGEHSQRLSHAGFAPTHSMSAFLSTLLRLQVALQGAGLGCVHFPGLSCSGSGSRVLHKGVDSVGPAFCAFPVWAAQATRRVASALSSGAVHIITSAVPAARVAGRVSLWRAVCLFWGADLRLISWRMSTVQNLRKFLVRNWKPVGSLAGDALSGAEFAHFPLRLALTFPLPPAGDGPAHSWRAFLWFCLSPLLCEWPSSALG